MIKVDQNHVQALEPCIFFHRKKIQFWFSLKTVSRPRLCRYPLIYSKLLHWEMLKKYIWLLFLPENHGSRKWITPILVSFHLGMSFSPFWIGRKKWYLYALKPNLRNWRFGIGMEYLDSQHPRVLLQHHATLHHFWFRHFFGEMPI